MTTSLAQSLWNARTQGHAIAKPALSLNLEQAYDLQREIVTLSGREQMGWKVGSTSRAAQEKLGTSEPGAGALLDGFCFASGDAVPVSPAHHVFVEGEFAFVVGRDMPFETAPDHQQIAECIEAMVPGIEVVGSRFESGLAASGREFVTADGGANIAFVGGRAIKDWSADALPDTAVELYKNGSLLESGYGRDALDHPLNVVAWLVGHCAKNGTMLKAGDVITTGTCTGLVDVAPGDSVEARFISAGELIGNVTASFTELDASS